MDYGFSLHATTERIMHIKEYIVEIIALIGWCGKFLRIREERGP